MTLHYSGLFKVIIFGFYYIHFPDIRDSKFTGAINYDIKFSEFATQIMIEHALCC